MRLDLFLKVSRLLPRRSLAQNFCEAGLIKVNGLPAKPAKEVKVGDEIEIDKRRLFFRLKVLRIPDKKQVSKHEAATLYEILSREIRDGDRSAPDF
jgi:ribosomal 50S subunit-recycling heat shock protein